MSATNTTVQDFVAEGTRFSLFDPSWSVVRDSYPWCAYEPVVTALLTDFLAEPDARFADIGALYGYFACWAARRHPGLPVVAFEPEKEYRVVLEQNLQLNGAEVIVAPYALVEGRRTLSFHTRTVEPDRGFSPERRGYVRAVRNHLRRRTLPVRHITAGVHMPRTSPVELVRRSLQWSRIGQQDVDVTHDVQGISLDEWAEENDFWPTVVKIDVHGAEGLVLRGMRECLGRSVRHILLELHTPDMLVDASHEEIISELENAGFELFEVRGFRRHVGALVPLVGQARIDILDLSTWTPDDLYYMRFLYARRTAQVDKF